jgi:hypothetical protein
MIKKHCSEDEDVFKVMFSDDDTDDSDMRELASLAFITAVVIVVLNMILYI